MKHTPKCPQCNKTGVLHEIFDAYMCQNCKLWLEKSCKDYECMSCVYKHTETSTRK